MDVLGQMMFLGDRGRAVFGTACTSWSLKSPLSSPASRCVSETTSGRRLLVSPCSTLGFQQVCSNELKDRAEPKQILN